MAEDNNLKSVVEALLFASEKPLAVEQIRKALDNLPTEDIRRIVGELKEEYERSNRGMRIIEVAGGFQMITPAGFSPFLKKMFKERKGEKLSKPSLETLAIVAYKQPVTKWEIESLRNVNADGVVASLLEKGLIRICGRKKSPGRPFVFGTTRQFLECFGLRSLDDLPKKEEFASLAGKADEVEQIPEGNDTQSSMEVPNASRESAQTD